MAAVLRFLKHFIPCWAVTYCVASILHSQMVLINLVQVNVSIPIAEWLSMTAYDLWGLLPAYGSAVFAAMLIAMLVSVWLTRHQARAFSVLIFMMAGALAMLIMLLAMHPILQVTLIAGARSAAGIALQCGAGLIGGLVFGLLTRNHHSHE